MTEFEIQGLKLEPLFDVFAMPGDSQPVRYQVVNMYNNRVARIIWNNLEHKWEYRTSSHPRHAASFDSPEEAFDALKALYRAE